MGPDRSARRPPGCPVCWAMISAAIAIAVSSGVRDTLLLEARGPVVVRPSTPHRPDVAGLGLQRLYEDRHVELGVVGQDADDGPPVHLCRLQELIRPGDDDLVGGRESLA